MPELLFPAGRLVYGHPSQKIHKKDNKKQPMFKDGQPVMVHSFGVAYPKDVFNSTVWPVMYQAASGAYGGQQPPPHFAYKFKDGDTVDRQGKPYANREGYAGHCVVHFETQFDLLAYRINPQTGGWDQITAADYKTGDYIAVRATVEGNKPADPTHTPGLFVNPIGVLHVGNGQAIINAPSADQMFGGQQFALPPGATAPGAPPAMPSGAAMPPGLGGAAPMMPGQPPGAYQPPPAAPAAPQYAPPPAAPGQPPVYAQPPGVAPAAPAAPTYPPAHDYVASVTGQPVPGAPPAYPMPPGAQPPR